MKHLPFVLIAVPISIFAEGGLPNSPYIYVVGKADVEKPADIVTLRFNLIVVNLNEAKANQQIQDKAAKTFAILDAGKIEQTDVIAQNLRSEEAYEDSDDVRRRGKFIGYKLTRPFSVKLRDVSTFPKLVDHPRARWRGIFGNRCWAFQRKGNAGSGLGQSVGRCS